MSRPIWKGHITFGLVSIPIALYAAENKTDIQFHLVDTRDSARIHYIRINENTGKEVPWEKIGKGYEYDKNEFLVIEDREFKKIAGENTKIINIEGFIDKESLSLIDLYKPYYIVPEKNGEKGYVILREILNQTGKIGITQVIIHTRQYLAALTTHAEALVLNLMHYPEELRGSAEFNLPGEDFKHYKISSLEIETARKLIDLMTIKWKPEHYQDEYQIALKKWIEEKLHSKKPKAKMKEMAHPSKGKVINFIDLLKKSLEAKKAKKSRSPKNKHKKSKF